MTSYDGRPYALPPRELEAIRQEVAATTTLTCPVTNYTVHCLLETIVQCEQAITEASHLLGQTEPPASHGLSWSHAVNSWWLRQQIRREQA